MQLQWLRHYNFLIFDETDSTNAEARRLVESGASGNFIIWAKSQTHGRGRYGRSWQSPPGNLYMSILLDSNRFASKQQELSFVTSLGVYNAIRIIGLRNKQKLNLGLKWPNDVLVHGAKIAGILLETIKTHNRQYLIIGIGLNIDNHPCDIDRDTTSMSAIVSQVPEVSHMLDVIMSSFEHYFALWQAQGFLPIRHLWLQKIYNPKHVMTVNDGRNRISGIFQDIDLNGAIRLKLASGQIYTLSAGEVFFGHV